MGKRVFLGIFNVVSACLNERGSKPISNSPFHTTCFRLPRSNPISYHREAWRRVYITGDLTEISRLTHRTHRCCLTCSWRKQGSTELESLGRCEAANTLRGGAVGKRACLVTKLHVTSELSLAYWRLFKQNKWTQCTHYAILGAPISN